MQRRHGNNLIISSISTCNLKYLRLQIDAKARFFVMYMREKSGYHNNKENEITYAASNNHPIVVSNNQLNQLLCDKMPVGKGERGESFNLYTIEANKGDMLYLYTDGYPDQFGGPKGKKFKYKPLNDLLLSIRNESPSDQKQILNSTFENWKSDLEQVDDVCIVGIKNFF